ncbi:MAG TPA: hypothetical protein VEZ90_06510 [Blastocatellia bacterium]|nr:hypothetical protein [Blastocatellia bacterium]
MTSTLGWVATAAFAASYFFKQPAVLRRIQAGAAVLWIVYGVAIWAPPVVVANLIVAIAAIYSSFQSRPSRVVDGARESVTGAEFETIGLGRVFDEQELRG